MKSRACHSNDPKLLSLWIKSRVCHSNNRKLLSNTFLFCFFYAVQGQTLTVESVHEILEFAIPANDRQISSTFQSWPLYVFQYLQMEIWLFCF